MKRIHRLRIATFILIAVSIQSCFVAKDYSRPEVLDNNSSYRTDVVVEDSATLASLSWRELFQDSILRGYIEMDFKTTRIFASRYSRSQ